MEPIRNGSPMGFPSGSPGMREGCVDSSIGRDITDSAGPMTLHPALPFGGLTGLAPQGTTIPLETFAFSSLYSSAMNTSNKGIESFPHLSSMYSAGTTSSRPISCPTNAGGPGRSFSQVIGSGYSPQSVLHQGFEMNAVGSNMPVRLSSSPNNFSSTNHTQTGSCFSQSNSSGKTNPTGTSVLWGSGMNPYNSQGYSGDQTLANRIANSLSKYRSVPIKRKSDADLGSPMKVYLSEKKMAARMQNLTISDNKRPVPLSMKEIEDRLSSDDEDNDVVDDKDHHIKLSKDLKDKLRKQAKDEILPKSILENIAALSCKPSMEIVLWKPPGGLLSDFLVKPSVEAESTEESTPHISSERTQSADMSMDASDEVLPDSNGGSKTIWVMPETLVPQAGASPASLAQPLGFGQPADMSMAAMDARAVLAGVQPGSMAAMNLLAMPSVGTAQGSVAFMTDTLGANMSSAATAAVPHPPVAPISVQHQFLEDNNNVISQQDLFDALDDEMDL
ncbi:uncharacterized protein LOC135483379 isoform X1 [Lineus longissimus]|uniref:uncharacterized protein LOC135483379 isoform X1 n=1 Tax=Lineus longissimus TaxID=88925 RepID=UPI00315DA225